MRSIAGASSTVQPSERRSLSVITPAAGADIGARRGEWPLDLSRARSTVGSAPTSCRIPTPPEFLLAEPCLSRRKPRPAREVVRGLQEGQQFATRPGTMASDAAAALLGFGSSSQPLDDDDDLSIYHTR